MKKNKFLDSFIEISTKELSREDWLKYRKKGIGGSDSSAIAGINPWSSPLNVYLDKTSENVKAVENFRMMIGNRLEGFVAELFTEETGKKVRNVNGILKNDKYPFAFANIDRAVVGEKAILECKTTNSFASKEWEQGVPPHYEIQCMHYMAITGAEICYIAVLIGNQEFKIHKLERDQETIDYLMKIEEDFWNNFIIKNNIPDPDGSDRFSEHLKEKYKTSNGEIINIDYLDEGKEKIEKYFDLKQEKKNIETQLKQIEQILQNEMKEAEQATLNDYKITWKTTSKLSVDTKLLKEENPKIYDKYLKTSTYRRFSIK